MIPHRFKDKQSSTFDEKFEKASEICNPVNLIGESCCTALSSFYWTGTLLNLYIPESNQTILELAPSAFWIALVSGILIGLSYAFFNYMVNEKYQSHHKKIIDCINEQESTGKERVKMILKVALVPAYYAAASSFAAVDFIFLESSKHMALHAQLFMHIGFFVVGLLCVFAEGRDWFNVSIAKIFPDKTSNKTNNTVKEDEKADLWTNVHVFTGLIVTFFCSVYSMTQLAQLVNIKLAEWSVVNIILAVIFACSEAICHYHTDIDNQSAKDGYIKKQKDMIKRGFSELIASSHYVSDIMEFFAEINLFAQRAFKSDSLSSSVYRGFTYQHLLFTISILLGIFASIPDWNKSRKVLGLKQEKPDYGKNTSISQLNSKV